jgi:hypothetical protein
VNLTQHFTVEDFERSDTAARFGLDNTMPHELYGSATGVCTLLEQVQLLLGTVRLTSGYRSLEVNTRIGGSAVSAHMQGRAADFHVEGMSPYETAVALVASDIFYDKLILEFQKWVHIQVPKVGDEPRKQAFTARIVAGVTQYPQGVLSA